MPGSLTTARAAEPSALALPEEFLLAPEDVFGEAPSTPLVHLFAEHAEILERLRVIADYAAQSIDTSVLRYFAAGNSDEQNPHLARALAERLFAFEGARKALDADFWNRALHLTDVLEHLTAARRATWTAAIRTRDVPEFTAANVAQTLGDLLARRADLLAERVEGIFDGLSPEHVTNSPAGFGKRMILRNAIDAYGCSGRDLELIADLRSVVAKFMGRGEMPYRDTYRLAAMAVERRGQWLDVDGGALRLRVYKKGTGHLEVHPDMAWRLNAILHHRHPRAIPPAQRTRPARAARVLRPIERPLPWPVVLFFSELRQARESEGRRWTWSYGDKSEEGLGILESLGGVRDAERGAIEFPYDARDVVAELAYRGTIPDRYSHQYYPTPPDIARRMFEALDWSPGCETLEPSAGTGALADLVRHCQCFEVSPLHCAVLRAKGHAVVEGDFLASLTQFRFDRVLMNPPFAEGQWERHLTKALGLLAPEGRLVALLPASARQKVVLAHETAWSEDLRFPGVSIPVAILTVTT